MKEKGPIDYLCLNDIEYLKSITEGGYFNEEELRIFFYLLHHRFTAGRSASIIDEKALHENPLY